MKPVGDCSSRRGCQCKKWPWVTALNKTQPPLCFGQRQLCSLQVKLPAWPELAGCAPGRSRVPKAGNWALGFAIAREAGIYTKGKARPGGSCRICYTNPRPDFGRCSASDSACLGLSPGMKNTESLRRCGLSAFRRWKAAYRCCVLENQDAINYHWYAILIRVQSL